MASTNSFLSKSLLIGSVFLFSVGLSHARPYGECYRKEEALKRQISYAQAHGNYYKAASLKKALAKVEFSCTERGVRRKAMRDIEKKEQKVREAQHELEEARITGSPKKIRKKEAKLREAQAELREKKASSDF